MNLLDAANNICNGYVCTLQRGQVAYSNKYVKRGRWYFEVTHIEGDFMFSAGFSLGKSADVIDFFPYKRYVGESGDSTVYYEINTFKSSEISSYGRLNASTFYEKQTYGIGIDIDTNLFFIQSYQEIRRYQFSIIKRNIIKWHVRLRESMPNVFVNDSISYNFGQEPFSLKVPYGFQPFIEDYNNICHTLFSSYVQINLMILHIIAIFTSDYFL